MPVSETPRGERRLLSLLFSDLAGSTELAGVLDPEDLRDIYEQTREIAHAAVEKYGGRVKDYMGDGLLAYFGYPMALERGAHSAVKAALEMVAEVARRSWPVAEQAGFKVEMRVGIHTGEVVIGDIGRKGGAHEVDAVVGVAPNIANRVQTSASPNSVAISDSSYRLIEGQFRCCEMAPVKLKGVLGEVRLFEVLGPAEVRAQVDRIVSRSIRPMVGRSTELERLQQAWQAALEGGHFGFCVRGEAGIGKSRLMAELKTAIRSEERGRVWEFQCSPYHTNAPYFAVIETIREKVCAFAEAEDDEARAARLQKIMQAAGLHEPVHFWLLADLLGLPYPAEELAAALAPEARKRTLHHVFNLLFPALSEDRPALYEFNDGHWIDASTAEWLVHFHAHQGTGGLVVVTSRPDASTLGEALAGMEIIDLRGLKENDVESLARSVAGGRILPHEVVDHIAHSCGGVPLFVEELTAALIHSDALEEQEQHYELKNWSPAKQVPFSLRDLIQSRLDQCQEGDREVMAACAVVGSEVTPRVIAGVLGEHDDARTAAAMERLEEAEILKRHAGGVAYEIRHALIRNVAYEGLLKAARAQYHVRVAELLRAGGFEGLQPSPALLAEHFTLAGIHEAAAPLWLQSAQQALRRSAVREAVALARRGLEVAEQAGHPLALREIQTLLATTLGMALVASQGFASPEAVVAFNHAEELLDGVQTPAQRFPVMWGLCITHLMGGRLDPALKYATAMDELSRELDNSSFLIEALWTRGAVLFWLGRLEEAETQLTEAVQIYRPEHRANAHLFGQDPGVAARVYLMQLLCFRLRHQEARACARETLELAHQLRHPHSLAWAMASETMVKLLLGDAGGILESGRAAIEYCMKQEHPFWLSATKMMTGWAMSRNGEGVAGLKMVQEGFALYEMLGTNLICPVFCTVLADCCLTVNDFNSAMSWVERGRTMVVTNNEQLSQPGVSMVAGQLMEREGHLDRAEDDYQEALRSARSQGSSLREIQATAALANLLAQQGRLPETMNLLQPYLPLLTSPEAPEFLRPLRDFILASKAP